MLKTHKNSDNDFLEKGLNRPYIMVTHPGSNFTQVGLTCVIKETLKFNLLI